MKETSGRAANTSLDDFEDQSGVGVTEHEKKKQQKRKKGETNEVGATNGYSEEKENVSETPKMNAFQFMMNSRHKSIGSNSPGREVDLNVSTDNAASKQELKARKSRFESWVEQRGAAKRQRNYEDIGNCINHKLEKRKKKLKVMLNIDCQSDDEVIMKRKKRCAVIESDSDISNDAGEHEVMKAVKKKAKRSRMSLNKTIECDKTELEVESVKLTPKSVKTWKFKIKLSMDNNKSDVETANDTKSDGSVLNEKGEILYNNENQQVVENLDVDDCVVIEENNVKTVDKSIIVTEEKSRENKASLEQRVLRTRKSKPVVDDDFIYSDQENTSTKKKKNKEMKVAPVFLKAVPKPKIDPKVVEARRQFLLSGVPSSLKREMERQQYIEEIEFDVFPTVSHIQQKSSNHTFWNLPEAELELSHQVIEEIKIAPFSKSLLSLEKTDVENFAEEKLQSNKIKNCKKLIQEIKFHNPDYPVYKVFNSIYAKSGYKVEKAPENPKTKNEISKTVPKRRGRPKKNLSQKKPEEMTVPFSPEFKSDGNTSLWTEKYKPNCSADIIGNHGSVTLLKEWLSNWLNDLKKNKNKCDSESEFEVTDDSCESTKMNSNTVILKGPTGSGKTAAVYAVCNELGFNVLEVNASSRRTGKRLLQELQEATQSHQVCKKETVLSSFVQEKKEKPSTKMCVLLIEDVDVVFEQDEGFTAAILQIMTTSKRPIILTTTEEPSSSIQRVISNHQMIFFSPLSSILTIWLQIVCLVEGFYVASESLDELLNYNRGDIRQTLLQLQLYVSSGGQRDKIEIKNETEMFVDSDVKIDDDNSNLSDLKMDEFLEGKENIQIHQDCVASYQSVKNFESFSLPHCNNLEVVWWNLPTMLSLSNFSKMRLERVGGVHIVETRDGENKDKLKMVSDCYETVAFADVMCGKSQFHESLERRWCTRTKDGLGLEEDMAEYGQDGVCNDLVQTLISGRIKMYKEKYSGGEVGLNMAVPEQAERRWRSKQLASEEKLQSALSLSDSLGRKAIALDYMPCLRTIARFEYERAANNTKRGNRFYNYLRNLGVRCSDNTYKVACDVFKIWD